VAITLCTVYLVLEWLWLFESSSDSKHVVTHTSGWCCCLWFSFPMFCFFPIMLIFRV